MILQNLHLNFNKDDIMQIVEIVTMVAGYVFSIGVTWGTLSIRIKQLEKQINEHKNISERLARIEEKINFIVKPQN